MESTAENQHGQKNQAEAKDDNRLQLLAWLCNSY
jgi:hypothetical protein